MRVWMIAVLLAGLLMVVPGLSPSALEVESGRVRLILHEGIGRFSLYARRQAAGGDYVPLFVDQDPRTSGISIAVGSRVYRLGDASGFTEKAENPEGSALARFEWSSKSLTIVQEFTPVSASPQGAAQGVRMSIRVTNRSPESVPVGLRMCLDTYLGEDNLSHFVTDRHQEIRRELTVTGADMVRYWLSPSAASPEELGLLCITDGPRVTSPDKIVFANWKRLSETPWDYETSGNRNFNLMPYSINDSAVCMYYDPVAIPAQGSREIVLILGNATLSGYTASAERTDTGNAAPAGPSPVESPAGGSPPAVSPAAETGPSPETGSIEGDLDDLNALIRQVDELLASDEPISDEQLQLMQEILSVIKDKSERYSDGL